MTNDFDYVAIQGWMRNKLELSGNELFVYSLIYSFSRDGKSEFQGSRQYIADWCGCTVRSVQTTLNNLLEKGHLIKRDIMVNGVKFCHYKAVVPDWVIVHNQCNEVHTQGRIFTGGMQNLPTINIEHNIDNKEKDLSNKLDKSKEKTSNRFSPPTVEEVKAYCEERGNNVDAERFVDFYTMKNWMVGKNKMKDWRAAVRTWERDDKKSDKPADSMPDWMRKIMEEED